MSNPKTCSIETEKIQADPAAQPRVKIDQFAVDDYAEATAAGATCGAATEEETKAPY